ncbi:MAG: hypothetical protein N3F07_01300 [Candidatus Micrarchaeota archaeon]|nr:hypothetical protein [Candidatus Micrarchaeota archaeon]
MRAASIFGGMMNISLKSLAGVVLIVGLIYALSTWAPNKLMLQIAVYVLMGILIYHLYSQFEEHSARSNLKKLVGKLYSSFPESHLTDEDLQRYGISKSAAAGLVKLGCMAPEGKGKYVLGERALHIISMWQAEHLNRQIFVLTVALLVVSIILVLSQLA